MDWAWATLKDRKALYRAVQRLRAQGLTDWPQLYTEAIPDQAIGQGYEDNFRAGRISRKNAARIARWMKERFPEQHAQLEAELSGRQNDVAVDAHQDWEAFLEEHGRYEGLSIVRLKREQFGLVTFARIKPVDPVPIKLGELFCFELDSPINGYATALQGMPDGTWHPLPLSKEVGPVAVRRGKQFLPFDPAAQQPIPLNEETETGIRRFVVVIQKPDTWPKANDFTRKSSGDDLDNLHTLNLKLAIEGKRETFVALRNIRFRN